MGAGEYSGHPPMESGVPWDEFTTISDPQMLATMSANKNPMMNMAPNAWNPATVPSGLPPASPMSAASPMNPAPTYTMQPDGSVWQMPPSGPSRAMSYPGQDMDSSYAGQFQQQMPPDLKRRMTTPAQTLPADSQSSSRPSSSMQAAPGSVPYPDQAGVGYTQWPVMNSVSGMGVVPYPMYGGAVQQPAFNENAPPMGHPGGQGRSGS